MKPLAILSALALASCAAPCQPKTLVVDYSKHEARLGLQSFPVALSGRGIGGRPKSYKTPTGTFRITQRTKLHRFGPILRLAGVSDDGYEQSCRGILVHRAYGLTTHGCVGIPREIMPLVYASLREGDFVKIVN